MSALGDAMKVRIGNERLAQLTNDDPTATTIDDTVLEAAVDDAVGDFERITGLPMDATNKSHVTILIKGILWKLEDYRGRDGGIVTGHAKSFLGACAGFRKTIPFTPVTSGTLQPSTEKANARPDMDRKKAVWRYGHRAHTIPEIATDD